jgi:hypothetical protein
MGAYDDIGIPVKGQPISSGAYGIKVRNAIIDLDRRVSSVDTSTGTGKVFSTGSVVLATTTETAALTLTGMVFKAGLAYECSFRAGLGVAASLTWVNFRIRKYNVTPASGTDYGEYFRTVGKDANLVSALGTIFVLNNTSADVTNDINLTVTCSVAGTAAATVFGSTASPRYLIIKPAGFAADYAGMGIQVA